ncbi:MAG TPA: sulfite exporter TauE/SafE family protein [Solirubrobacteraceae bacterium]|jgi:hypothetical protein
MLSLGDTAFLIAAGILAGIVGTAGAITSLVSFPALLIAGVPAFGANVANIVAITTTWPGSALSSRPELAGRAAWLRRYGAVAAVGGAAGTALLLATPSGAFERIVPFLVAGGALTLLATPRLRRLTGIGEPGNAHRDPAWMAAVLLIISVYNGYFGAGSGVMTLALLLIASDDRLPVANALKNMLVGVATVVAAVGLVLFASVRWGAVVPLGIGAFVGAMVGPHVARRLPERALRAAVAAIGLGLAVQLWLTHGS